MYVFILHWVFAAAPGLSPGVESRGSASFAAVSLLPVLASPLAEHGLGYTGFSSCSVGSVVVAHGLSCSKA